MGGSRNHTHRLVMARPGVFHCLYCGQLFGAPSPAPVTAPPQHTGPVCFGPIQTRVSPR